MHIATADLFGGAPSNGQEMIAAAMHFIGDLLDAIEKHPEVENPDQGVLGGRLTRISVRASSHTSLGNYKKATKDLTKALKIDENYTAARQK